MQPRLSLSTTAIIDCDNCRRQVEAIHMDCDRCAEQHPEQSSLERCYHYECRRCGQEI